MSLAGIGVMEVTFFALLPLLFLGGLVVLGVLLIGPRKSNGAGPTSSALQVLEERYARGEITRDEFLERRNVLRGAGN